MKHNENNENFENIVSKRLRDEEPMSYPQFGSMWGRIQERRNRGVEQVRAEGKPVIRRSLKPVAFIAIAAVVLTATPVLAAVSNQWIWKGDTGVERAVMQGFGQQLDQVEKHKGVTVTLQHAIADDNRTVILFTLDNADETEKLWDADIYLLDAKGQKIEGQERLVWNEEKRLYNGYFEADWSFSGESTEIQLVVEDMNQIATGSIPLGFDPSDEQAQRMEIGKLGLTAIEMKAMPEGDDKLVIYTSLWQEAGSEDIVDIPMIRVTDGDRVVKTARSGIYGTPGDRGDVTLQDTYKRDDLLSSQVNFKLEYTYVNERVQGQWKFDSITLSKEQMKAGTFERKLKEKIETSEGVVTINKLVVTPTQIRVEIKPPKGAIKPYNHVFIEVNGRQLETGMFLSDDYRTERYRAERPLDLTISETDRIDLRFKYEVVKHEDYREPIKLTNISEKKQSFTKQIGGYEVDWTYYMQDGHLYVVSSSENQQFGGVNQTHIGLGKERIVSTILSRNFLGDGINQGIDVYKDFKGKDADLYIFYYTTDHPEREIVVPLQ